MDTPRRVLFCAIVSNEISTKTRSKMDYQVVDAVARRTARVPRECGLARRRRPRSTARRVCEDRCSRAPLAPRGARRAAEQPSGRRDEGAGGLPSRESVPKAAPGAHSPTTGQDAAQRFSDTDIPNSDANDRERAETTQPANQMDRRMRYRHLFSDDQGLQGPPPSPKPRSDGRRHAKLGAHQDRAPRRRGPAPLRPPLAGSGALTPRGDFADLRTCSRELRAAPCPSDRPAMGPAARFGQNSSGPPRALMGGTLGSRQVRLAALVMGRPISA